MRYFLAARNGVFVAKHVVAGDTRPSSELIARFEARHPNLTVTEVTEAEFAAVVIAPEPTQAQKDWEVFKLTSPTAAQSIRYLAKAMGLE